MKRAFLRGFQLFLIITLLGNPGIMSFSEGSQADRAQAALEKASECLGKQTQEATDEMLQFTAGGHVLGFKTGNVFIASGDHALQIEFMDAQSVSPEEDLVPQQNEEASSLNTQDNRIATRPLNKVSYNDLWDGVTLVYETHNSGVVKSTYIIQPSETSTENPVDQIRLHYNVPVDVDHGGNLVFSFGTGQMKESRPVAWQEIEGQKIPVEVSYYQPREREMGFNVGFYNSQFPLVIDPVLSWNTFMGSTGAERAYAIAVDTSGNLYVGGDCSATWGTPVNAHAGGSDAFVAKLNSSGVRLWHTFMGSSSGDFGNAIAVDTSGNVYVGGDCSATWGTPVNAHAGGSDAFVAKLNNSGVRLWHTFMGSSDHDDGNAIAVDSSGNVYVVGYSESLWGIPINNHSGTADAFAAKLNSSGVRQWHTFMGSTGGDYAYAVAVDSSGMAYIGGHSQLTWGAPVNNHNGSYDLFAAKLNSSGLRLWHTFMGSASEERGHGIAVDSSGNVYVAGHSIATWGTPVNAYVGTWDAFAAKLNGSGEYQWHTFMGSTAWDFCFSIAVDSNGMVYVSGDSNATWGTPASAHAGDYDAFVTKLNKNGVRQWHTFMGSGNEDNGNSIAVDSCGKVYVTGASYETWGTPVNAHAGLTDAFVAKVPVPVRADILGTWDSSGVWYRNSETGAWHTMTTPASLVAAGDLDGDGTDDLIGVWSNGLWAKYSYSGTWFRLDSGRPTTIACGDMNGDGRVDVLGTWPSGTYYKNSISGAWVYMSIGADLVTAGDIDGDGIDDLIGVWSSGSPGLWVKYSSSGVWQRLSKPIPTDIAAGDINGDRRDDVLGTWPSGMFYYDTLGGSWVYVSPTADLVAIEDMDGDGVDDLIGTWSPVSYQGLWVKYSATMSWEKIVKDLPTDIDAGLYRCRVWDADFPVEMDIQEPSGVGVFSIEGPGSLSEYDDLSDEGPSGWNFVYQEEANLVPQASETMELNRVPGPCEPGFICTEQKNIVPQETKKHNM